MFEQIKEVINTAIKDGELTETRVPYTYHHDYVRGVVNIGLSRGEIAQLGYTNHSLYCAVFMYLVTWNLRYLVETCPHDLRAMIAYAEAGASPDVEAARNVPTGKY